MASQTHNKQKETHAMDNLKKRIEQQKDLTREEVAAIVAIIGHGCRQRTKDRLTSILNWDAIRLPAYGIFERVQIRADGTAKYCSGQSYPDEIRYVRELIIKA